MKKFIAVLTGFCALAVLASTTLNTDLDTDKMKKEIRVFEKIIRTTFDDDQRGKEDRLQPDEIDAIYLAGQGVMLDVNMGNGPFGFDFPLDIVVDMNMAIEPVIMGLENVTPTRLDDESDVIDRAYEEASRALEHSDFEIDSNGLGEDLRIKVKALANERAKLIEEVHLQRNEVLKKLSTEKSLGENERKRLEEQAKSLSDRAQAASLSIRERMEKLRVESDQQWGTRIKPFIESFLDTVCEYGAGIKSLPANEHLTVVFRNADRSQGQGRDLIYVFPKSDLLACRNGELSAAELKNRAVHYKY